MNLWYFDGVPHTLEKASRSFNAVSEKFLFMGHHHVWLIVGSDGEVVWDIEEPVRLVAAERYLVVTGAVIDGWCATLSRAHRAASRETDSRAGRFRGSS